MMAATVPYRLQIFLPEDVREALRDKAHKERISQQKLVLAWLREKLDISRTPDDQDHDEAEASV